MRFSADDSDRGFKPFEITKNAVIKLDGVKVDLVITADEEEGTVLCLDDEVEDWDGEGYPKITRHGNVTITFR